MTEVSYKYKEIWNELQKKLGLNFNFPIPPVYDSLEDLKHLYNILKSQSSNNDIDILCEIKRKSF